MNQGPITFQHRDRQDFDRFFGDVPAGIDVDAIRSEWMALTPLYQVNERQLPLPLWARRGLADTGEQAWSTLCQDLADPASDRPLCIYIHIPFCASRCSFCDCYSFPLKRRKHEHIDRYINLLAQEMQLWSGLGAQSRRPVSTVHFGGGTPTFLDPAHFQHLVQMIQAHFNTTSQTEWALESTTSELTDEMILLMDRLGFTRLHVGVQSLEDRVREAINRREPAQVVLSKIARAVEMNWVVSVDLILGLPGQTLASFDNDIRTLSTLVDGFSLYELQLSSRNRRFALQHHLADRQRLDHYLSFQAASQRLRSLGYQKTMFNHFASQRDTNLYFSFPERGEDCLALGTIADGVFGDYHYRHPPYKAYCASVDTQFPGLQGGYRRNKIENRLYGLEIALLSTRIAPEQFVNVLGYTASERLFHQWHEAALIEQDARQLCFRLTGNGSWFVAVMMNQISQAAGVTGEPAPR